MAKKVQRNSHWRRNANGSVSYLSGCDYWLDGQRKKQALRGSKQRCSKCGALVRQTRMRSGKIVQYEVGMGGYRTRHACSTIGDGISRVKADGVEDLFDWYLRKKKTG